MIPAAILALVVFTTGPALAQDTPAAPSVPEWGKDELKTLVARSQQAGGLAPDAQDAEMARLIGSAYRVLPQSSEAPELYARRTLKKFAPGHPEVKNGQWVLALTGRFYADSGKRADQLSRLEAVRADRQFLEGYAQQAKAASEQIKAAIQVKAAKGEMSPVPTAPGDLPESFGCEVYVKGEKIEVNRLARIEFANGMPPAITPRTGKGALRELYASMKEYNVNAKMMGLIDPASKQGFEKVRFFLPAIHPARYLNELMRAAKEASMKVAFLMVMDPMTSKMREIPLLLAAPTPKTKAKKGAKAPSPVKVKCADEMTLQGCATYLSEQRGPDSAPLIFEYEAI